MHFTYLFFHFLASTTLATQIHKARLASTDVTVQETEPTLSLTGSGPFSFSSAVKTATFSLSRNTAVPTSVVHNVNVSHDLFYPEVLHASVGDLINFYFHGPHTNYSVAESTFFQPCQPKTGGVGQHAIFSGFVPVTDDESGMKIANDGLLAKKKFTMQINTTDPIWLYCPTIDEVDESLCKTKKMSMVVNPLNGTGNVNQTLEAYREASAKIPSNVTAWPNAVFGGNLIEVLKNDPYLMANGSSMYGNGTAGHHESGAADTNLKMRRTKNAMAVMAVAVLAGLFAVGG